MTEYAYGAGEWTALAHSGRAALLEPGISSESVTAIWELISSGSSLESWLEVLVGNGLSSLPGFGLVETSDDGVRVVVRGDVSAAVEGQELAAGGMRTWREHVAPAGTGVVLKVADGDTQFPLIGGIVLASLLQVGEIAEPAEEVGEDAAELAAAGAVDDEALDDPDEADVPDGEAADGGDTDGGDTDAGDAAEEPVEEVMDDGEPGATTSDEVDAALGEAALDDDPSGEEGPAEGEPTAAGPGETDGGEEGAEAAEDSDEGSAAGAEPVDGADEGAEAPAAPVEAAQQDPWAQAPVEAAQQPQNPWMAQAPAQQEQAQDPWAQPPAPVEQQSSQWGPPTGAPVPPAAVEPVQPPVGDHDGYTMRATDLPSRDEGEVPVDQTLAPVQEEQAAASEQPQQPAVVLSLSTGQQVELDRPALIGRAPESSRFGFGETPRLVTVPSPQQDISRTHVEVKVEGDHVLVTDLRSTNGTVVVLPGNPPRRLHPGESVPVPTGTVVDLGDGVTALVAPPNAAVPMAY